MLRIYKLLTNVVCFFAPIILKLRIYRKKEDENRYTEKLCIIKKKRTAGKLVWFHAASVGELMSIIPILEKFERLDGMFLYYYNKDTSMLKQKEVPMTYLNQAEMYWRELNNRLEMGCPPVEADISPVNSWECNYCDFKDHCWETE